VGAKMVAEKWVHVPTIFALAAIVAVLGVTMLTSILTDKGNSVGARHRIWSRRT